MPTFADQKKMFYYILLAALLVHSCFLAVKFKRDFFSVRQTPTPQTGAINVQLISEAMKELALTKNKKQIVLSEDSASTDQPADPAFLSDKNRNFDRQTMARNVDVFQKAAKGNGTVTQAASKGDSTPKKKADFKDLKLSDIGMLASEPTPKEVSRGPASVEMKGGMQNGDPTTSGMSATNDYVEEVALGDFTHLNTVEYKFFGFYHRIRQKLEQFWGRSIQEKATVLFKSGRRIPASQDLITSLRITMNAKGEIIQVKVLGASGVKELDDAAIESFNQAGPFPNPPSELLVNGKATIEWGFVVKS
jgi:TonB family protein